MTDAKFLFTFTIVADDPCRATHEPASIPGGYVFIPAALFIEARDEAEFVGMLAHAMEHIAERHSTRNATTGQLSNYGTIPLIFLGGWSGTCIGDALIPSRFLAMQQNNELEADRLTVPAMARAGFDPVALASYLQRVQPTRTSLSSPLPPLGARLEAIRQTTEGLPAVNYLVPGGKFETIQKRMKDLVPSTAK